MKLLLGLGALEATGLALALVGCGGGDASSGDDGGGASDGSPVDGTFADTPTFGDGAGEGGLVYGCSPDLQNVIDQSGSVVMKCPPDQGCAGGQCIKACDAAAASRGNVGCDFVVSTPPFDDGLLPPCFAVFVANTWDKAVGIQVSRAGQNYDVTQFGRIPDGTPTATNWQAVPPSGLPIGEVAILFLSNDPASTHPIGGPMTCPVQVAVPQSTAVSNGTGTYDTGRGQSFHVVTDVPISLYDIMPYGGARSFLPSAQLVQPTTAWGTNYLVVIPKHSFGGPPWLQVVAAHDNTQVQIVPTYALPSGTNVSPAPQNQVTTYTLNNGEFIQWAQTQGSPSTEEMSGTILSSNQPIAVPAGSSALCLSSATSTGGGCDSAHQLMLPVSALGSEYVASPYATRRLDMMPESIPYRLVGAKIGTTLTYDPPVVGAPTTLTVGQYADFEAIGAFTVKSQDKDHVFYVTQMMPGCNVTSGSRTGITPGIDQQLGLQNCLGDEEWVDVLPPAQWLSKYVFFTDPTYGTTNLTITRLKTPAGYKDVKVDCLGNVAGWQPVGKGDTYEVTTVDLVRGTTPVMSCTNGGHVASSDGPFGLVVWGVDEFASYGYPAGGNAASINTVVVPPVPK